MPNNFPFPALTPEAPYELRKEIRLSERRAVYVARFTENRIAAAFRIDGMIVTMAIICDGMIVFCDGCGQWHQVFVELKGKNVCHAIDQILASLQRPELSDKKITHRHIRIAASRWPANGADPSLEHRRRILARSKVNFKFLKSQQPDIFDC